MAQTLTDPAALTASAVERITRCGVVETTAHTLSGEIADLMYRCGLRYCADCAEDYHVRLFAVLMDRLEDAPDLYMVTLTARQSAGQTYDDLQRAISRDAAQWTHTRTRLDWQAHRERRGRSGGERSIRPARYGAVDGGEPLDSRYHGNGRWERDRPGDLTYVWGREITTGADGDRWHVHRHVVVDDLGLAQQMAGAWDSYHGDATHSRHGREWRCEQGEDPYRVQITHWPAKRVASYLAAEVGGRKRGSWVDTICDLDVARQMTYARATTCLRRYDAAGRWRPLGMTPDPGEDPVVAISDATSTIDAATYLSRAVTDSDPGLICSQPTQVECRGHDRHRRGDDDTSRRWSRVVGVCGQAIPLAHSAGRARERARSCPRINQSLCTPARDGPRTRCHDPPSVVCDAPSRPIDHRDTPLDPDTAWTLWLSPRQDAVVWRAGRSLVVELHRLDAVTGAVDTHARVR